MRCKANTEILDRRGKGLQPLVQRVEEREKGYELS